jgi:hypothetical protein
MELTTTIQIKVADIKDIAFEDIFPFVENCEGRFTAEEKIKLLRSVLGLNQMADIGLICNEIINLKR